MDREAFEVGLAVNHIAMLLDDSVLKACETQLKTIENYVSKYSDIKQNLEKVPRYKMRNDSTIYYDSADINKLFEGN